MKKKFWIIHLVSYASLVISGMHFPIAKANPPNKGPATSTKAPKVPVKAKPEFIDEAFCDGGAKDVLTELNSRNKIKVERMKQLDQELQDELRALKIINDTKEIRKDYERRIADIARSSTSTNPADIANDLDALKASMRNGMVLQALSLSLKDKNLDATPQLDMESLCVSSKNALCDFYEKAKDTPEIEQLNRSLTSFHNSYKQIRTNQTKVNLREEVKKITSTIPKEISPQMLLDVLQKESPTLTRALMVGTNKEKLLSCLTTDETKACQDLMLTHEGDIVVRELLGQQITDVKTSVKSHAKDIGDKITEAHYNESSALLAKNQSNIGNTKAQRAVLDDEFLGKSISFINDSGLASKNFFSLLGENYNGSKTLTLTEKREFLKNKLLVNLRGKDLLFFKDPEVTDPNMNLKDYEVLVKNSIAKTNENVDFFDKSCADIKSARKNMDKCYDIIAGLEGSLKKSEDYQNQKIRTLRDELQKLTDDKDFSSVENLKAFTIYQHESLCAHKPKKDLNFSLLQNCSADPTTSIQTIDTLGGEMVEISNYLSKKTTLDNQSSPELLASMKSSCSGTDLTSLKSTDKICNYFVNYEQIQLDKKKQEYIAEEKRVERDRKITQFEKDYHVQYNRETGGTITTKKKSTLSLLATGIVPQAGILINGLMMNSQAKAMIPYLQDQGMYQKQLLHNINFFNSNPWAYGYNYYNGYFGINSGLDGSLFNQNILTPSTNGISSGFSF